MPKYLVRRHLVKGQALPLQGDAARARDELLRAARLADRLGYPAWSWRAWSAAAEASASPNAQAKAASAMGRLAASLGDDLRVRFLAGHRL